MNKFKVSVTGCGLGDFLYNNVDFSSETFSKYQSNKAGDGGLEPGKLVFTHELENFGEKSFPEILSEIAGMRMYDAFNVGGPALVSTINAAQLLCNDPVDVSYYGAMGNDDKGKVIQGLLSLLPISMENYQVFEGITPYTDVLSDPQYADGKGERTFINNIACAADFGVENLDANFWNSDVVVFGGTALVPKLHNELTSLLQKAKSNGSFTAVLTVYDFLNEKTNPSKAWPIGDTLQSLPLIDLLIMDYEEASRISGTNDIESMKHYYRTNGANAFIITHGANPSHIYSSGKLFEAIETTIPVCTWLNDEFRANPELKGDTTGCGDNFAGGVLTSVVQQLLKNTKPLSLREAALLGTASGGFACYYVGGTYFEKQNGEKAEKINQMLDSYKLRVNR